MKPAHKQPLLATALVCALATSTVPSRAADITPADSSAVALAKDAFWLLPLYELPSGLLVANPLHRYLINSPLLPDLKRDGDGGLTLYLQRESPGKDKESNWPPAPSASFMAVLRLYWPKDEAINGKWKQPPLKRAE